MLAIAFLCTACGKGGGETGAAAETPETTETADAADAADRPGEQKITRRRLGPNINTPYTEIFPVATADGRKLYVTRDDFPDPTVMGILEAEFDKAASICDELESAIESAPEETKDSLAALVEDCRADEEQAKQNRASWEFTLERADWPQQVYVAERLADGTWGEMARVPPPINSEIVAANLTNVALTAAAPDRNTLVISGLQLEDLRNDAMFDQCFPEDLLSVLVENGSRCLFIKLVTRGESGWETRSVLQVGDEFIVNLPRVAEAAIGPDTGIIVFAGVTRQPVPDSTRKAAQRDLYLTRKQADGAWTVPRKLEDLSSDAAEASPFIGPDGKTLYFVSDRDGGQGGHDIWMSVRQDESWLAWSAPRNLGPDVNTPDDETSISVDATGRYAFMSSGKGAQQDIYEFDLPPNLSPAPTALVRGVILIGGPLAGNEVYGSGVLVPGGDLELRGGGPEATGGSGFEASTQPGVLRPPGNNRALGTGFVSFHSLDGFGSGGTANVDPDTGEFQISLPVGGLYSAYFETDQYVAIGQTIDLRNVSAFDEFEVDLPVVEICEGSTIRLNNLFFEVDKSDLLPPSITELQRLRDLLEKRPGMHIEIAGHTDATNTDDYNQALSMRRATAVADWLIGEGIRAERVSRAGYGETQPVADNATAEGRQLNRRVEFRVLEYPGAACQDRRPQNVASNRLLSPVKRYKGLPSLL